MSGSADARGSGEDGIGLVVLLFLTCRLSSLLMLQYGGLFGGSSDFDYYFQMGRLTDQGLWPYLHYWSEYPPLFPEAVAGLYRLAALVGGGPPSPPLFETLLRAVLLPFDLGNLLLVYGLARRLHGPVVGLRCAWIYTALFSALFVWMGWFDPLPVFLLLLGLKLLVDERWRAAGVAIGLGVATKLVPGLLALVAVKLAWSRGKPGADFPRLLGFAAVVAGTLLVVVGPLLLARPALFVLSVRAWTARLPWESPWAILDGYYSWGLVPSLAARVAWPTFFPSLAPGGLLGLVSLGCLLGVLMVLLATVPDVGSARGRVALTGALVTAVFALANGFSPQFVDWIIPFAIILLPGRRGAVYATALTALVLLGERYLYFWLFPPSPAMLAALVAARTALFAALVLEFAEVARVAAPTAIRLGRAFAWGVASMGGIALVAIGAFEFAAFGTAVHGIPDPAYQTYDLIRASTPADAALVTFDLGTYERLGTWFNDRAFFYLDPSYARPATHAAAAARAIGRAYPRVVTIDPAQPSASSVAGAEDWLRAYGVETSSESLGTGYRVGVGSLRALAE